MGNVIFAVVLGVVAFLCFFIATLQFKQKGFLFNNAYIYADEKERKEMNKKPHYMQSGVVFTLIGVVSLINAVDVILKTNWLLYLIIFIIVVAVLYAIVSSIIISKNNK